MEAKCTLKIKIFMFLHRKVILTKDNFAECKWNGCKKCACDSEESIHHLFIVCPFARIICRIVQFTFNITPPTNITKMFENWLNGIEKKNKAHIRVGVYALVRTIWKCQNSKRHCH